MRVTGTGNPGEVVKAELVTTGVSVPDSFEREYSTYVKADGTWELSLESNLVGRSAPTGSYYKITEDAEGTPSTTEVTVPHGFGTMDLSDLPGPPPAIGDAEGTDAAIIDALRDRLIELGLVVLDDS